MAKMQLVHEHAQYRDFEPITGLQVGGFSRITFDAETHTAYGTLVNPRATMSNGEEIHSDQTMPLVWDDAETLIA